MRAILLTLVLLSACSDKPEIERSPVSAYPMSADFPGCPTGGTKPSPLPAIRLAADVLAKLDEWEKYGMAEDQAGKVCRKRFYDSWKDRHNGNPP